jgi:hypothetical protein
MVAGDQGRQRQGGLSLDIRDDTRAEIRRALTEKSIKQAQANLPITLMLRPSNRK